MTDIPMEALQTLINDITTSYSDDDFISAVEVKAMIQHLIDVQLDSVDEFFRSQAEEYQLID